MKKIIIALAFIGVLAFVAPAAHASGFLGESIGYQQYRDMNCGCYGGEYYDGAYVVGYGNTFAYPIAATSVVNYGYPTYGPNTYVSTSNFYPVYNGTYPDYSGYGYGYGTVGYPYGYGNYGSYGYGNYGYGNTGGTFWGSLLGSAIGTMIGGQSNGYYDNSGYYGDPNYGYDYGNGYYDQYGSDYYGG